MKVLSGADCCWCKRNDMDHVLGPARNGHPGGADRKRPCASPTAAMWQRTRHHGGSGTFSLPNPHILEPRARRVAARVEHLAKGPRPARRGRPARGQEAGAPQRLHEQLYCARRDTESRINGCRSVRSPNRHGAARQPIAAEFGALRLRSHAWSAPPRPGRRAPGPGRNGEPSG